MDAFLRFVRDSFDSFIQLKKKSQGSKPTKKKSNKTTRRNRNRKRRKKEYFISREWIKKDLIGHIKFKWANATLNLSLARKREEINI